MNTNNNYNTIIQQIQFNKMKIDYKTLNKKKKKNRNKPFTLL